METSWSVLPPGLPEGQRALVRELRGLKDRSELSLTQLASRSHYSKSSCERWLNGKRPVPLQAVARLARACGEDPDKLLTRVLNSTAPPSVALPQQAGSAPAKAAPTGAAPTGGLPVPRRTHLPRCRTVAAPGVAAALAGTAAGLLLGGALSGPAADSRSATQPSARPQPLELPRGGSSGPPAARCSRASCAGKDPQVEGCAADAESVTWSVAPQLSVYLRFSRSCQATWGLIANARAGDTVTVYSSAGPLASAASHGTDAHTPMTPVTDPAALWVCERTRAVRACSPVPVAQP